MRMHVPTVLLQLALTAGVVWADAPRDSETPTGWWYFTNATEAQINAKRDEGYRLVKLAVVSSNPMRFCATLVYNSGEYYNPQDGWWFGLTYAQMEAILSPSVRALQIYPYLNSDGNLRYAIIVVTNTGQYAKGWWWDNNATLADIDTIAATHNMRLIAWERRPNEGARFSAVFVQNSGEDQRDWWRYAGVSAATINNLTAQHGARITDLTHLGGGQYDVILEESQGQRWWWYSGYSSAEIQILYGNRDARIYDIQPAGAGTFAVLLMNNANALEERISVIMRSIMDDEILVPIGASLKRVNGSYRAAIHRDRIFDPASTIKVLHHVHAMRQVALGNIGFTQNINVNGFDGSPGGCPPEDPDRLEPLDDVLRAMMENSDNVRTEAIKDRFGQANINATADALGMPDTELVRRIGCGGDHNTMTLADLSSLHEEVVNGYLNGPTGDWRDEFYDLMINSNSSALAYGGAAGYPDLGTIIDEEAADIGLPDAKRLAFRAAVQFASKAGSVGLDGLRYRSSFAWFSIPFRTNGVLDPREFVTGLFVDGAVDDTNAANAISAAAAELLRDEIRAALLTWLVPATLELTPAGGFVTSGPVGGPFTPNGRTYTLLNSGDSSLAWLATDNRTWARVLPSGGNLAPGGQTLVTIYTDSPIEDLLPGVYTGTATFTNTTNGIGNTTRAMQVTVFAVIGDLNCDGEVNNFDIDPFVLAISDPSAYARAYPGCPISSADINGDGQVNNFDIDPFIDCITNGGCQ